MTQRRTQRIAGFTLIELLAAMAILAVVSLMAVQSLSGALMQRTVMTGVDHSAEDLARRAELSVETVRKIERGLVANPGFFTVAALARHLDLQLDDLAEQATTQETTS